MAAKIPSTPKLVYLPGSGPMGMMGEAPPVRGDLRPLGKTIHIQKLGTVVGRRGAGLTAPLGPSSGDQLAHTFNNYNKSANYSGGDGGGLF